MRITLIVVLTTGLTISGCGGKKVRTYKPLNLVKVAPIADQYTPDLVKQICDAEYKEAKRLAEREADEKYAPRRYTTTECDGVGINRRCKDSTYLVSGGWKAGAARGFLKATFIKERTSGVKSLCYAKHGYAKQ